MNAATFWTKVQKLDSGCWEWTGSRNPQGYGYVRLDGERLRAHRASYLLRHGFLPKKGIDIHHVCINPPCVNPDHLQALTHREHMLITIGSATAINARKTHCPKGHPLSGENLVPHRKRKGERICRTCVSAQNHVRYLKNKEKIVEAVKRWRAANRERVNEVSRIAMRKRAIAKKRSMTQNAVSSINNGT